MADKKRPNPGPCGKLFPFDTTPAKRPVCARDAGHDGAHEGDGCAWVESGAPVLVRPRLDVFDTASLAGWGDVLAEVQSLVAATRRAQASELSLESAACAHDLAIRLASIARDAADASVLLAHLSDTFDRHVAVKALQERVSS